MNVQHHDDPSGLETVDACSFKTTGSSKVTLIHLESHDSTYHTCIMIKAQTGVIIRNKVRADNLHPVEGRI